MPRWLILPFYLGVVWGPKPDPKTAHGWLEVRNQASCSFYFFIFLPGGALRSGPESGLKTAYFCLSNGGCLRSRIMPQDGLFYLLPRWGWSTSRISALGTYLLYVSFKFTLRSKLGHLRAYFAWIPLIFGIWWQIIIEYPIYSLILVSGPLLTFKNQNISNIHYNRAKRGFWTIPAKFNQQYDFRGYI